jgi:uncharacterized pyridoxamine 5'-phosphate oxidase family protein
MPVRKKLSVFQKEYIQQWLRDMQYARKKLKEIDEWTCSDDFVFIHARYRVSVGENLNLNKYFPKLAAMLNALYVKERKEFCKKISEVIPFATLSDEQAHQLNVEIGFQFNEFKKISLI